MKKSIFSSVFKRKRYGQRKRRVKNTLGKVLRLKLFSKDSTLHENMYFEIVKLVNMWTSFKGEKGQGDCTEHWIENLAGMIKRANHMKNHPQAIYAFIDDSKNIPRSSFKTEVEKADPLGKELLEKVKNRLLTEKVGGKFKYLVTIKHQGGVKNEDYDFIVKYIAHCLSGVIFMPGHPDTNGEHSKVMKNINYNLVVNYSKEDLINVLKSCFVNLLGPNDYIE